MSRAEKYLPFIIAVFIPTVSLINANPPHEDIAVGKIITQYLQISITLLILWFFNKWLLIRTRHKSRNSYRYLVVFWANAGLILGLGLLESINLIDSLASDVAPWLIMIRLSIFVLLFNVILRVFETQREKNRLETENLKFQLDTLKQQINPHFLFNSLNTLLELIEENQEEAIDFTRKFSNLYRIALQSLNYDFIPMRDEFSFLNDYWSLLKIRFTDDIELDVRVAEEIMDAEIPPLSLQFLVENNVKHNKASTRNPLQILISESKGYLIVSNNINPKKYARPGERVGLENLQKRFSLLLQPIEYGQKGEDFVVKLPMKV